MTLKVIHRLAAFSNAIRPTSVQHFTRFQLTVCLHLLVWIGGLQTREQFMLETRKVNNNKMHKARFVDLRPLDM